MLYVQVHSYVGFTFTENRSSPKCCSFIVSILKVPCISMELNLLCGRMLPIYPLVPQILPFRNQVKAEGVEWQCMGGVKQPPYPFTVIYERGGGGPSVRLFCTKSLVKVSAISTLGCASFPKSCSLHGNKHTYWVTRRHRIYWETLTF